MRFGEHLNAHLTPEWRTQYINYQVLKKFLLQATAKATDQLDEASLVSYFDEVDEVFFSKCKKELDKINNFASEKLSEAYRKFVSLEEELKIYTSRQRDISGFKESLRIETDGNFTTETSTQFALSRARPFPRETLFSPTSPTLFTNKSPTATNALFKRNVSKTVENLENEFFDDKTKIKTQRSLRLSLTEFYLSLVLLQNYQSLNFTGFRKILKKHDRLFGRSNGQKWLMDNVASAPFNVDKTVEKMIEKVEVIFTELFERGDRQKAMKTLRVPPLGDVARPKQMFRIGIYFGMFIMGLLIIIATLSYSRPGKRFAQEFFALFDVGLVVCVFLFLLGINIFTWKRFGVNYVLIFEINPRNPMSHLDIFEYATIFILIWTIGAIYFIFAPYLHLPRLAGPLFVIVVMVGSLLIPQSNESFDQKFWLLNRLKCVILSPFYPVRFSEFWLADQITSLSIATARFPRQICYLVYLRDNATSGDFLVHCKTIPLVNGFYALFHVLPVWFRLLQCVRRYFDMNPKQFYPHLTNAGKYFCALIHAISSGLYTFVIPNNYGLALYIITYIVASAYSYYWTIIEDWGLMQSFKKGSYFLRSELVYSHWFYYFAIVNDLFCRLLFFPRIVLQKNFIAYSLLSMASVIQRFVWNFLRLENEHLNNCGLFRAVRNINIEPIERERIGELGSRSPKKKFKVIKAGRFLNRVSKGAVTFSAICFAVL